MTRLASLPHCLPKAVCSPRSSVGYWGGAFIALILGCWGASFVIGFETALAVLTMACFAAAIVGLFRPALGLLGIGMLCTLEPLMRSLLFTGGWWRWHTVDYWLLLVAILFAPLLLRLSDARSRLIQLFAALVCLEVLVSPDWYGGLADVAGVVAVFGLVVYFARAGRDAGVWRWLGLVCGTTGSVGGMVFLVQQASLPQINRNAWAYLPLTALFAVCLAFPLARPRVRGQVILATLAVANYTLVFLSGSRGTLLTATACGLFLLVATRHMRRRWMVAVSVPLIALAITTQFSDLQTQAVDRINVLLDPHENLTDRRSGRSQLALAGWRMFLDRPLGVGTGGFAVTRADFTEAASLWTSEARKAAHAGWIKILAENGLPGLGLMGAYVLSFTVAGWRSRNRSLLMLGVLVTLAFGLGFVSTEYQSKGLWFLAAGVMVLLRPDSPVMRREPVAA